MSLSSLLSVARGALLAHQRAVGVIGHNIANAETPGYTRQRVELGAASADTIQPYGQVGRGVQILDIQRLRVGFYDQSFRREGGLEAQYQTMQQQLEQVSAVLGEPGDTGIGASLDDLIDSFNSMASNPTDPAARAIVAANAAALTDKFKSIDRRLRDISGNIGTELRQAVTDVNGLVDEIGRLNVQIRAANGQAPDLLDRRDLLIDQLSQLVDVRVTDQPQGTVDVSLGGLQLVSNGGGTQPLSVSGSGPYQISIGNPPAAITVQQGKIKGLLDAYTALGTPGTATARATGLMGQLDDLALGIVSAVNQIHSNYNPGTNPLQPTITPAPAPLRNVIPFFDPNGVTAATIDLNAVIKADPSQIAPGYSTAAGDNSIVLRLAELRTLAVPVPGATAATPTSPAVVAGPSQVLGEYYTSVIAAFGAATQAAGNRAESQTALVQNIEAQRQDASGVNIDEEMVRLIEHQQAYAAAARLIQTADEMLQELMDIGR